jgi:Zn-dependent protease
MSGFRVGRILGIDVRVHPSWFAIVLLVMWVLAGVALPADFPHAGALLRLLVAGAITLLFFLSLLAHELAHALVAVRRGIPVHGITFFLFGGVAHTGKDSSSPLEEFLIAVAGPIMSVALAALFLALWWAGMNAGWEGVVVAGMAYVGALNLILALFNLLPGFPMDGGRVLRALLWLVTGDVTRATRWASHIGVAMGLLLMGYGGWRVLQGDFIGGVWLVLIAGFIARAARMAYRQHLFARSMGTPAPVPDPLGRGLPDARRSDA